MRSVTLNFADWLEAIFWRSFWHIFSHSFWHIFWHSFWHIFWLAFWHDISSDILSDISKTKHNIHSFKQKPLHKLYIYLTPRSKSNIHDNFVSVKCHRPQCIRPPRQKAVKSKDAKSLCIHIYMTCIRQPRQPQAVESQDAMQVSTQPQLHLMACVNHEVRPLPLWLLPLFCVGGSCLSYLIIFFSNIISE